MKACLHFRMVLPYMITEYGELHKIGQLLNKEGDLYEWQFPLEKLERVEKLTGRIIEFEPDDLVTVTRHAPPLTESIEVSKWKGKDRISVLELPEVFQVITHRKDEDGTVKELSHEVPKNVVNTAWTAIRKQPLHKPIKASTVAKNIVELLSIDRFHRETGSFDFAKFFGNRSDYNRYYYLPMKVLSYHAAIKHHKSGLVERLMDEWVVQTRVRQ